MIDTSMCEAAETGLDATGATDPATDVTGSMTSLGDMTSSGAGSNGGSDGCRCNAEPGPRTGFALASLGLVGLFGVRRRRRGGVNAATLAVVLACSGTQGCCDPAVATETSSEGESSTVSDGGSAESTGEPALPEWAIGVFSSETDKVGMTVDNPPWYGWGNIEISATGTFTLDWYNCTMLYERQVFGWTMAEDGQSLSIQTMPPAEVFTFGNGHQVSELVVEPGSSCETIMVRYRLVDPVMWVASEQRRGNVCPRATGPDDCTFTFEWCNGVSPVPCE